MESWLHAQELFERALEGKEQVLGEAHPSTLDTVLAMGSMWQERGEVKDAKELFERAIKGFEQVHGLGKEPPSSHISPSAPSNFFSPLTTHCCTG